MKKKGIWVSLLSLSIILTILVVFWDISPFGEEYSNPEALDFAKAMTEIAGKTWPEGNVVWRLELTPKAVTDDIVAYRRSVTYCKVEISVSEEWFRLTETEQRNYVKSSLDVLHKPPAIPSKTLDYYPNSSGEIVVMVGNKAVATGNYSKTKTNIQLKPGSYKKEATQRYSIKISVLNNNGLVGFQGITNLPDSESILFTLKKGDYMAQAKAVVRNGECSTEFFSNRGRPLAPGTYSLHLNVFNPKTNLMVEAKGSINLPQTKGIELSFSPTKL